MRAIVQDQYGSPDVLQLRDVDKPVVKDDEALVRVRAAAVNIGDWHLLRGVPYVMRTVSGLLKPRRAVPGLDIAGKVEAVGHAPPWRPYDRGRSRQLRLRAPGRRAHLPQRQQRSGSLAQL